MAQQRICDICGGLCFDRDNIEIIMKGTPYKVVIDLEEITPEDDYNMNSSDILAGSPQGMIPFGGFFGPTVEESRSIDLCAKCTSKMLYKILEVLSTVPDVPVS